jgi:hypothetical protein
MLQNPYDWTLCASRGVPDCTIHYLLITICQVMLRNPYDWTKSMHHSCWCGNNETKRAMYNKSPKVCGVSCMVAAR